MKEESKRIIDLCEMRGDFVTEVDGFVYWWPDLVDGHMNSSHLRIIADELDKRNKPMQKSIDDYFKNRSENDNHGERK